MRKYIFIFYLFIILLAFPCRAQLVCKVQTGVSYIEHFSTGITFCFSGKHNISLLYGSNLFVKPNRFSSYLLQYDRFINGLRFKGFTPKLGIKGGYSIFSNDYYRWKLLEVIPFVGLNYQANKRIEIAIDMGGTYSRASLKRVGYGNIGKYKEYLPEFKLTLFYRLIGK